MMRLHLALCAALASAAWATISVAQNAPPPPPQKTWKPDAGDEVIVGFSNAPPRAPVVTGPLWNGNQPPPTQQSPGSREPPTKVQKRGVAQAQVNTQARAQRKHVKKPAASPKPAPVPVPVKN
jgi:beta-lactam-binding protein with PASTA domain